MNKTSQRSWRSLYPFESHYLDLHGTRLHFLDVGSGNPLLMVHGNPTWSFYWRNLTLAFRDHYRVVVPDHVGCGLSDKPQDYAYDLQTHTDNVIQLIDQLDLDRITLVAHDWGGAIGLGAAVQRRSQIARIVLLNTGAFPPPYIPWRIRACRIPGLGTVAIRGLNLFCRAALTMAVQHRLPRPVREGLLAPYDSWQHRIAVDRFVKQIPASPRHRNWSVLQDLERDLQQLTDRPWLLVWGMKDWCFRPSCLQRFQSINPSAEVVRLPDAGHYVVEDATDRVVEALQMFLSRHRIQDEQPSR
jgi:haloalkane dehalogenase